MHHNSLLDRELSRALRSIWLAALGAGRVGALASLLLACATTTGGTAMSPPRASPGSATDVHELTPCPLAGGDNRYQLTGFGSTASAVNKMLGGDPSHPGEYGSVDPETGLHRFNIRCSKSLRAIAMQEFFSPTVTEASAILQARRLLPADAQLLSSSTVGGCWQGQFQSRALAQALSIDDSTGIADVELLSPAANGNSIGMMAPYSQSKIQQLRIDLGYGLGQRAPSC